MNIRIIKRKGTLLSSVAMLSTAMLLTACGGDGGDSPVDDGGANPGESGAQALLYAYPDNQQTEVSTAAPVVLRFSSAVNVGNANNSITLYEGDAATGTAIDAPAEAVTGEPNNVTLNPAEDLKPNQLYTVVIEDLPLRKGTAKDQTLTFTTRPLHEGPKSLVVKDDEFKVSRRMPDGSEMEPVMDFSSFRFQFTQPIDRATANYGEDPASTGPGGGTIPADSVVLRDSSGAPVPATLLVDGAYMTVDPEPEYLNAGETYTLDITADLASTYGVPFGEQSYPLTPKDSSPGREPAILVQKLTQGTTSRLTGKPVNEVPVNGTLLGENDNITQASADVVRAELADVTTYTDVTPIRLPKGTVLNGAEINPILIGGEVPAGFGSGDVTMTVLSDASGYLVPNPYAGNNPDALRIVHLMMDVGIATSEPRANGAFTQDLLHIELVGLAEVDPEAGVLNLDAVSVVEPNILGQEYGYGMLSFQLQSYKNQSDPPEALIDTTPPQLLSWTPGDNVGLQQPTDPITLNFDEPISPASAIEAVAFYKNGGESAHSIRVDGASVTIYPSEALEHDSISNPTTYRISVDTALSDIQGNKLSEGIVEEFSLPKLVEQRELLQFGMPTGNVVPVQERSPILFSVYPGYPCALTETHLSEGDLGRCAHSFPGWNQGSALDIKPEDDHFPLPTMPANRPIIVIFSKPIDPSSVSLGGNFNVSRISATGEFLNNVPGDLEVTGNMITFTPDDLWASGEYYSYSLASNGDRSSSVAVCNGDGAICGMSGYPIQTSVFPDIKIVEVTAPTPGSVPVREWQFQTSSIPYTAGGPDLVQYFKAEPKTKDVLQVLSALPSSDVNRNFVHDRYKDPKVDMSSGIFTLYIQPAFTYPGFEEKGAESQPADPFADPAIDPQGVVPPPNSAKLLSLNTKGSPKPDDALAPDINGFNVGCGFSEKRFWDPDVEDTNNMYLIPSVCPEQKFTYLSGSLIAEVTSEFVPGRGIKVILHPAQIMSSAIPIFTQLYAGSNVAASDSGAQVMRMRYNKSQDGQRDDSIVGWISQTDDGPELNVTVDLYIDALELSEKLIVNNPTHSLISYPVTMELSGPLRFLEDGRMVVEQYNIAPVEINIGVYGTSGAGTVLPSLIPEYGSRLQYVTQPIK